MEATCAACGDRLQLWHTFVDGNWHGEVHVCTDNGMVDSFVLYVHGNFIWLPNDNAINYK